MSKAPKILVVDDETIIAMDLQSKLIAMGFEVPAVARSAEEAIRQTSELTPDVVLMDIRLDGGMDGVQAAEIIRQRFGTPVIFLSAYSDKETLERAKAAGPYGYLIKPIKDLELKMIVDLAITRSRAQALIQLRAREQQAIANLGSRVLSGAALSEVMGLAVNEVREVMKADHCQILQLATDEGSFEVRAATGEASPDPARHNLEATPDTHEGYTAKIKQPVIVTDMTTEARFPQGAVLWGGSIVSGIAIPILGTSPLDVMSVHSTRSQNFTDEDVRFLEAMGSVLSLAIERKGFEEALQRSRDELEERVRVRTRALNRANQELTRSNAELERFAHVSSHDLKEPLRIIRTFAQLLERHCGEKLDPAAKDYLNFITSAAGRMYTLIGDILTFSSLQKVAVSFQNVNCNELLEVARVNLQILIAESGAEIRSTPLPTVEGNQVRLVQLFQNLIGNAIKFRKANAPVIEIAAEERDQEWLFSVRDDGIGIEPEFRERIFVMFQRLNPPDRYPGTGIGLAVCRKVVEQHRGRIWVDSQPGVGATFYFTLPKNQTTDSLDEGGSACV